MAGHSPPPLTFCTRMVRMVRMVRSLRIVVTVTAHEFPSRLICLTETSLMAWCYLGTSVGNDKNECGRLDRLRGAGMLQFSRLRTSQDKRPEAPRAS